MLSCPVCSAATSLPLVTVPDMPLVGCCFAESRASASEVPRGTIELAVCSTCGHIFNRAFEPDRIDYGPGYENALDVSPRHRAESTALVDRLITEYGLRRKSILEIGCGTAAFLLSLCRKGGNRGIGYDPTQQPRTMQAGDGSVAIVAEIFTATDQQPVDFICSQHVLEHLAELNSTLHQVHRILNPNGVAYFQVPNGLTIFRDLDIWDVTYEHVSYFSPASLQHALLATGFSPLRLESSFGGQYLDAEALGDEAIEPVSVLAAAYPEFGSGFPSAFAGIVGSWKERIAGWVERKLRIVLWGAGTKAVSFLNMLSIGHDDGIEYVVDINPKKAGLFVPGTAQKIVPPQDLREYSPDIIVVMNREYAFEIRSMVNQMGLYCDLILASPILM